MLNPGFLYLGAAIPIFFFKERFRRFFSIILSISVLIMVFTLSEGASFNLPFLDFEMVLLEVDNISRLLGIIFAFAAIGNSLYSLGLAPKSYYFLSYIYIGSALSLVFVGDLFSFYLFWEGMTISSYFLIFNRNKEVTSKTSYYYFIMHLLGGMSLLCGIFLQYSGTGSILIYNVQFGIPFFILGIGIKLAFIGLHTWLPQNYANVSFYLTLLLVTFTTNIGLYGMYRLLGNLEYLAYGGVFSAIVAVFFALRESKGRRILSYHIIAQISYMIAGVASLNFLDSSDALVHLFTPILYKALLFMVMGVVIYSTGEEDIFKLGGLAKKLPLTTFCAIVGALSISGFPLFSGYVTKIFVKVGLENPLLIWGLYLAGIGTALSFLNFIYCCFFSEKEVEVKRGPTLWMKVAMLLFTIPILIIGIWPGVIELIYGLDFGINYYSLPYIWEGVGPTLWALIIFMLAHNIMEPKDHKDSFDLYPLVGEGFNRLGRVVSDIHNGNLARYLLWIFSTLLILWIILLV